MVSLAFGARDKKAVAKDCELTLDAVGRVRAPLERLRLWLPLREKSDSGRNAGKTDTHGTDTYGTDTYGTEGHGTEGSAGSRGNACRSKLCLHHGVLLVCDLCVSRTAVPEYGSPGAEQPFRL
jgi:hypothetical protein